MRGLSLGTAMKAALVAGLAAGFAVAAFHLAFTEPLVERAIELEAQLRPAQEPVGEPLVGRTAQRGGLVVGFLVYGLTWSLLYGAVYHLTGGWLPGAGAARRALVLALAGYWTVGLLPWLKYPPNPPGVGDPDTIAYRQALYLGLLGLSSGATLLAALVARSGPGRRLPGLALLALLGLAIYALLPNSPDPVRMPAEVVDAFRALSLAGLTLFWAVLGLIFALLTRPRPGARDRVSPARVSTRLAA